MPKVERLVIGLDSSTQSTKAIAWTRNGEFVAEGRAEIPMQTPQKERFEQDPEDWWNSACTAINQLCAQIDIAALDGLAVSNQRETIGFFGPDLRPVHPAIVWLDQRAVDEVEWLCAQMGEQRLHRINGKPRDVVPSVHRLSWMTRQRPDVMAECKLVADVHTYLCGRLTGQIKASWTSADPSGAFDISRRRWSPEILQTLGLSADLFAPAVRPASLIGTVTSAAAQRCGLPPGLPIYAAGGDGQCAGLGVDGVRPGRVYLNLGTAIITGIWAPGPNISSAWRSMTSPTGDGYFLEGVLKAGTFFLDWLVETYAGQPARAAHMALQEQAESITIGTDGLLVCPYLSGAMNPFWDMQARAAFFGLSSNHGNGHLYRAAMEALTGEIARTISAMRDDGLAVDDIVAVGGGANSRLWRRMLVDATGVRLTISKSLEASSLGAAMAAAVGVGWFSDFGAAAAAMSATGDSYQPDASAHEEWRKLLARQKTFNDYCCHNQLSESE